MALANCEIIAECFKAAFFSKMLAPGQGNELPETIYCWPGINTTNKNGGIDLICMEYILVTLAKAYISGKSYSYGNDK